MITFNADEIFEMAEEIERNGAKFYRVAADSAEGQQKALLLRLSIMEDEHEKLFAEMKAELTASEKQPQIFDPDHENVLYLSAMADDEVFKADPSEKLTGEESDQEILNIAIDLEKDSVIFYQCMKEMVPKSAGKERLDWIINQEIGHIHDLYKQLKAIR